MKISMFADFAICLFRTAPSRWKNDGALYNMKAILLPDFAHTPTADGSGRTLEGLD
jgi:hypothetical protein